jgi:hypothetical protein
MLIAQEGDRGWWQTMKQLTSSWETIMAYEFVQCGNTEGLVNMDNGIGRGW